MEKVLLEYSAYIWLLLIPLAFLLITRSLKTRPLPPSPPSLPLIGHLHLLRPPLHQSLHRLTSQYGPVTRIRLGSTPAIIVASADAAKALIKAHDQDISDRPLSAVSRHFAYGSSGFAFSPYGPYWRFMKKLCVSELLSPRTVDALAHIRRRELRALLRTLAAKSAAAASVDLSKELIGMTTSVVAGMAAGTASMGDSEAARRAVKGVAELIGAVNLADFVGFLSFFDIQGLKKRMREVRRGFDVLMERIIAEKEVERRRRRSCVRGDGDKDLLDMLLDAAGDEGMEIRLTRENIKSFILDIFTAGSDTSAATTEWALAELINHPEMLEKAREEIDNTVGKDRVVEESDIQNLNYLQAVVKETLRLHPAAPIATRKASKDFKQGDFEFFEGNIVMINLYSVNRDPEYWEEPLEFRPNRFVEDAELSYKGMHFHYLPFGSGRRMCPGMALAIPVVTITLAALIQCFEWEVDGTGGSEKLDMSEEPGIVILRAKSLICFPKTRLHPLPPEILNL